jgi:hypothetical protein
MSKKVYYETGGVDLGHLLHGPVLRYYEDNGYHVVISKDIPDEPKVERREITIRHSSLTYDEGPYECGLHLAIDSPDFAGFEFEDGTVDVSPWRKKSPCISCFPSIMPVKDSDRPIEHAKYVLFRKG